MLDPLHQRLAGVVIERLPYADLIRRYDAPGTLFFLDPPYWGCEGDYGLGVFERADFERLAEQLAGIAGRFILTINATDGARECSAGSTSLRRKRPTRSPLRRPAAASASRN